LTRTPEISKDFTIITKNFRRKLHGTLNALKPALREAIEKKAWGEKLVVITWYEDKFATAED
jgi:hypothetical protein